MIYFTVNDDEQKGRIDFALQAIDDNLGGLCKFTPAKINGIDDEITVFHVHGTRVKEESYNDGRAEVILSGQGTSTSGNVFNIKVHFMKTPYDLSKGVSCPTISTPGEPWQAKDIYLEGGFVSTNGPMCF